MPSFLVRFFKSDNTSTRKARLSCRVKPKFVRNLLKLQIIDPQLSSGGSKSLTPWFWPQKHLHECQHRHIPGKLWDSILCVENYSGKMSKNHRKFGKKMWKKILFSLSLCCLLLNECAIQTASRITILNLHAGNVVTSAETAHGTPRFVKAPRMRPQGKYKYCPEACEARAAFAATADSFGVPVGGRESTDIRVSHLKRLSCNTNTPYTSNFITQYQPMGWHLP